MFRSLPLEGANGDTSSSDDVTVYHLHPSSTLNYEKTPEYVLYQELVRSSSLFMKHVSSIKWDWVQEHRRRWEKSYAKRTVKDDCSSVEHSTAGLSRDRNDNISGDNSMTESVPKKARLEMVKPSEVGSGSQIVNGDINRTTSSSIESAKARYLARKQGNT